MATRSKNTLNLVTRFDSMLLDLAILIAQYPQFLEAFQPATSYTTTGKAGLNQFKQLAKQIKQLVPVALLRHKRHTHVQYHVLNISRLRDQFPGI